MKQSLLRIFALTLIAKNQFLLREVLMKKYFTFIFLILVATAFSTTIYDIQYTTVPGPDGWYPSPLVGQIVTVTGIVTGSDYYVSGNSNRFFMTDPGGGAWKGIFVFNYDFIVAEGDEVEVSGTVIEYYGMTELSTITDVTILSTGNAVPAPVIVQTANLVTPATAEQNEGCLVEVQNAVVTSAQNTYGEWFVTDTSAVPCQVDDGFFQLNSVTPPIVITIGMEWIIIRGCVDYSYNEYAINPRTPDDLIDVIPLSCDFSADPLTGIVALDVNFTDLSTGNITSWEWDFDNDGTIDSNDQNPVFSYTEVGVYTVSLTIGEGTTTETETKVDYITVNPSLIADFSAVPLSGLAPLEVQFTDATTGTPTTWEWDFDNDGTIDSNEQNPLYTYTIAGDYSVSLTVSDAYYSTTETKIDFISVGDQIIADFSADPLLGLVPLAVQFTDSSVGGINSWEWDFDNDGTIDSNEQDPSYTYTSAGTYTVVLSVGDGTYFDTETKVDYITVVPEIIADFNADPLSGSAPLQVQFTDNSAGDLNSWEWDFDNDGTIDSNEQDPSYTYTAAGLYTVVLTVGDGTFFDTETKADYIEVIGVGTGGELIPNVTSLSQNYPNPFNPSTTISFNVQEGKEATLMIFNMKGQLLESYDFSSGNHNFEWNAVNQTSGIYFYKLVSGEFSETRKMILLK